MKKRKGRTSEEGKRNLFVSLCVCVCVHIFNNFTN